MISQIEKKVEGKLLSVDVTCAVRKFASHEIKYLTTQDLIDILKEEYKIKKTISSPSHRVGNTRRGKTRITGTWTFEIETRKAKPAKKQTSSTEDEETILTTTSPKKPSIRGRMSKLAQEYKEENIAEQ